eukprot:6310589-Alexandrium_andersonii.AAC.1
MALIGPTLPSAHPFRTLSCALCVLPAALCLVPSVGVGPLGVCVWRLSPEEYAEAVAPRMSASGRRWFLLITV